MDLFRKRNANHVTAEEGSLSKTLSALDLVFMGIGAIIGAGIFILTGIVAATTAGPGIVFSFILSGFACAFSALSYAELAASLGGCGSAYGYAYAGFGELIAWVVGWDLLLEYTISVSAVSVGWSSYFNLILKAININLPDALTMGFWGGGILDILSIGIVAILTWILILGTETSSKTNDIIVAVKLIVIFLFIAVAIQDVNPKNWHPFLPFGWGGVVKGAAIIFFAYIGFDAVSTAAEEVRNPQRDLPWGILGSLVICTILYIVVSAILTGIAPYTTLNVASPLSHALNVLGHRFIASIIGVGAIAGLTTVLLVMFFGLTRVFLAMARDGLLPPYFAKVSDKTKTPIRIIFLCGMIIALIAGLLPMSELVELVNIGTLLAFGIVCSGVIVLRYSQPDLPRPFKTPFMPVVPILGLLCCLYLIIQLSWVTLLRFVIWLVIGFVIYFAYSRKNSVLATNPKAP